MRARLPRLPVPRYTVRLRLTLLYGGVFLVCGAVLLGIAYLLVRQTTDGPAYSVKTNGKSVMVKGPGGPVAFGVFHVTAPAKGGKGAIQELRITKPAGGGLAGGGPAGGFSAASPLPGVLPPLTLRQAQEQARQLRVLGTLQHHEELHQLLVDLGIALAIMAILSMGLGWLVAGRALRPLQTITKAARAISATNLHKRLSLKGPDDELRELGDTFDDLLERLEQSFAAQRQFVANASHELRTPLTLERAIIEVALADPSVGTQELRETCERVLAIGDQQERMIESLLTLARSERGLDQRVVFDLERPVAEVVASRGAAVAEADLELETKLASALTSGDRRLVERLASNLLDNAIHHNVPGGWIKLATRYDSGDAVLSIENSGPVVAAAEVERLFEPFTRVGADRSTRGDGHGLGLSIVAAIVRAHGARLLARARPQGGLAVEVRFRAAPAGDRRTGAQAPTSSARVANNGEPTLPVGGGAEV
jgi:signal transduction histidine kinase